MTVPQAFTPDFCDLRDFPYMPVDIGRLFGSEFHATATDAQWRAGMTLWLKSWHQVPAASLPDDDVALARLAEFGRDLRTWRKVKEGALRGWTKCSDGRLYHPVVAEKALEAMLQKLATQHVSAAGNAKKHGYAYDPAENEAKVERVRDLLRERNPQSKGLTKRLPKMKPAVSPDPPADHPDGSPDGAPAGSAMGVPQTSQRGPNRREVKGNNSKSSEANASGAGAPPSEFGEDDRANLFGPARQWLQKATGKSEQSCRSLLGRWLKRVGDDAGAVLEAIRRAKDQNAAEPVAWIEAALHAPQEPSWQERAAGRINEFGELIDWAARAAAFARTGQWLDYWGDRRDVPAEFRAAFGEEQAA